MTLLSLSCPCSLLPIYTGLGCLEQAIASCFFLDVSGSEPVASISGIRTVSQPGGSMGSTGDPDGNPAWPSTGR
jgi:hypothetical protein